MKFLKILLDYSGIIFFLLSVLMLSTFSSWSSGFINTFYISLWVLIPSLYICIVCVLIRHPKQLKVRSKSDISLVVLYLEYVLMFAGVYAIASILSGGHAIVEHAFISEDLMQKGASLSKYFHALFLVYIDALYFSVSVATTVGFGDIHAKHPLVKIFVIFEVISCFYIVVLGAGYYLGRSCDMQAIPNKQTKRVSSRSKRK